MFDFLHKHLRSYLYSAALKSYGWERRKEKYLGNLTVRWRDPYSGLWYSEKTALRLMKVQALEDLSAH